MFRFTRGSEEDTWSLGRWIFDYMKVNSIKNQRNII